jgi:predicted transposase YdaD
MSKPFDATMRKLLEIEPAAWLRFLRIPVLHPERIRVIDSNLSTVTAEADKVLWVGEPEPWIEHVELQAGRDAELPDRIHSYNTGLGRSHNVPVHSTVVLLRPSAEGPQLTGLFERRHRNGDVYDWFRYDIVRIWQTPVDEILASGLPVTPLAPVADVSPDRLPSVLLAISERLLKETTKDRAATLWAATKVLMGLRYRKEEIDEFVARVSAMVLGIRGIEESTVYQDIFAQGESKGRVEGRLEGRVEGAVEEARRTLLRLGRIRFGMCTDEIETKIGTLAELDQLNLLLDRILIVSSWEELFNSSGPAR